MMVEATNPVSYSVIIHGSAAIILYIVMFKTWWTAEKQRKLCKLINVIAKYEKLSNFGKSKCWKLAPELIIVLFLTFIILFGFNRGIFGPETGGGTFALPQVKVQFLKTVLLTKFGTFIDATYKEVKNTTEMSDLPVLDIGLGSIGLVALCLSHNLPEYNSLSIFGVSLAYWLANRALLLKSKHIADVNRFRKTRKRVKVMSRLLNEVFQNIIFAHVITIITYFSINLHNLFAVTTWSHVIKILLYVGLNSTEYFLVADSRLMVFECIAKTQTL